MKIGSPTSNVLSRHLAGHGTLNHAQLLMDALSQNFSRQAVDPISLLSMTVGSIAFRFSKLGFLEGASSLGLLRVAPRFAQFSATALGIGVEVSAFNTSRHLLGNFVGLSQDFPDARVWKSSFVDFAVLRGFSLGAFRNPLLHNFLQSNAMALAHGVSEHLGYVEHEEISYIERLARAQVSIFQMNAGMSLVGLGFGQQLRSHEKYLETQMEALSSLPRAESFVSTSEVLRFNSTAEPLHNELSKRVEDPPEFRRYVAEHVDPEDARLGTFVQGLTGIDHVHRVSGDLAALRFQRYRGDSSSLMRRGFFDLLIENANPQKLVTQTDYAPEKPLAAHMIDWLQHFPLEHADPWTRHYALRLGFAWMKAHPEIASPEFQTLRMELGAFALRAQQDSFIPNVLLGWHLFKGLSPHEAMDNTFYADFPFARNTRGSSPDFGMPLYEYPTPAERSFRKYVRQLNGVSNRRTGTAYAEMSLYDIHPYHSLVDFNPNTQVRSPVTQGYYQWLASTHPDKLDNNFIQRVYLQSDDMELAPVVGGWKGEHLWLGQSHHRTSALYYAGETGVVPREMLQRLRLLQMDWSAFYPLPIYLQYLSRGAKPMTWDDLLPGHGRHEYFERGPG